MRSTGPALSYRDAGVDIDAATGAVGRIAERARAAFGATPAEPGQSGAAAPIGHFGGLYRLPSGPDRLLVASADGVGTKLKLAFILGGDAHTRMGNDIVSHCANDILALGARPLFFLDYVAMGQLDPEALDRLIAGIVAACQENGMALIGGETAEMPGMYAPGEYDVAGFIVGEVHPDRVVDGSAIHPGDVLIGLPSGGLQTNGYSLARKIVGLADDNDANRAILAQPLPGGDGGTIGDALLAPHRSFLPHILPLLDERPGAITGMAHITGGGLIDNVPRMLPDGLAVEIDPASWQVPPIFAYLVSTGQVPMAECHRVFNMGIGFVVTVRSDTADEIRTSLPGSVEIGRVVRHDADADPRVRGLGIGI